MAPPVSIAIRGFVRSAAETMFHTMTVHACTITMTRKFTPRVQASVRYVPLPWKMSNDLQLVRSSKQRTSPWVKSSIAGRLEKTGKHALGCMALQEQRGHSSAGCMLFAGLVGMQEPCLQIHCCSGAAEAVAISTCGSVDVSCF